MKHYLLSLLFMSGLCISCSKDKVIPSRQTTATLSASTWRMTAYTFDLSAKNGTAKTTHDFFKSFSPNFSTPCLGKSTITFTPAGKVLWNSEIGACALNINDTWRGQIIEWGMWEMNEDQTKLSIDYSPLGVGVSSLPNVYSVSGSYDIVQMDQSTLVLGATRIIGQRQDSVMTDRVVFIRIQ